ncbi:hypothetical protein A2U01_0079663, partial [Trifolium medium]|nr:hypothetical protein [Trifolium medium]
MVDIRERTSTKARMKVLSFKVQRMNKVNLQRMTMERARRARSTFSAIIVKSMVIMQVNAKVQ